MGNTHKIQTVQCSKDVWRIQDTNWIVSSKDSSIVIGRLVRNIESQVVVQNLGCTFNYNDPVERIVFNNINQPIC